MKRPFFPFAVFVIFFLSLASAVNAQICSGFSSVVEVVDPNPTHRSGNSVTIEPTRLVTGGPIVTGFVADGVTPVLLRVRVGCAGTTTFATSGNTLADGKLKNPITGAEATGNSITVDAVDVGGGVYWAFTLLTAPFDYVRSDHTIDDPISISRNITINATHDPSNGAADLDFEWILSLHRPPIVLLHGIWSDGDTFTWPSLNARSTDGRYFIHAANYQNSISFVRNAYVPYAAIRKAVTKYRELHIAATQADVIAHSMGAVLTRLYVAGYPDPAKAQFTYRRFSNFNQGDIHKFIPITSPFRGSPLPYLLLNPDNSATKLGNILNYDPGHCTTCGAVADLKPISSANQMNLSAEVKVHAITSKGGSDLIHNLTENNAVNLLYAVFSSSPAGALIRLIRFIGNMALETAFECLFNSVQHDLIVGVDSQIACLSGNSSTLFPRGSGLDLGVHFTVNGETRIEEELKAAIDASVNGSLFANSILGNVTCNPIPVPSPNPNCFGFSLNGASSQSLTSGIRIIDPAPDTHFTAGTSVTVTVEAFGSFDADAVMVALPFRAEDAVSGGPALNGPGLTGEVFSATLDIPIEALGRVNLAAIGRDDQGVIEDSEAVPIIIDAPAPLVALRALEPNVLMFNSTPVDYAKIIGEYSNGNEVDVTEEQHGTHYATADANVASVDPNGVITSQGLGTTTISVTNSNTTPSNLSTQITIKVLSMRGDSDDNGVWDLNDFIAFASCYSGSIEDTSFTLPSPECREMFDFDGDGDVDLNDFDAFLVRYTGPRADCDNSGEMDLREILLGILVDASGNGVPDICECTVSSLTRFGGGGCGSCCSANEGMCSETPQSICEGSGGSFHDAEACSNESGACNLPDGGCQVITQICCEDLGGNYDPGAECEQDCSVTSQDSLTVALEKSRLSTLRQRLQMPKSQSSSGSTVGLGAGNNVEVYIQGGVLNVRGTTNVDGVYFEIDASNSSAVRVNVDPSDTYQFPLSQFSSIDIKLQGGDDTLVFDDKNGQISNIFPTNIDLGDGQDTIIGGTGALDLNTVYAQLNVLSQATNLISQADQIISDAGAVSPLGDSGNNMITNALNLVDDAYQNLILPATDLIDSSVNDLILPATDLVEDSYNILMAQSLQLLADGYNNLAVQALELRSDAQTELADPANSYINQAQSLQSSAASFRDICKNKLIGGANGFINNIEDLANQAVSAAERCRPEPNTPEPPEHPYICTELDRIADCAVTIINRFELDAGLCESDGNQFEADANEFNDQAQLDLGDKEELYQTHSDILNELADALVIQADSFAAIADNFRADAKTNLEDLATNFETTSATDMTARSNGFESQTMSQVEAIQNILVSTATLLTQDLNNIISQASGILENLGSTTRSSASNSCSQIETTNVITGGIGPKIILGTLGNDLINGTNLSDLIIGGPGDDKIFGQNGLDLIFGGGGINELHGGQGVDLLVGGESKDCLYGDNGIDLIFGLDGDDEMLGGSQVDIMLGMEGSDLITGDAGIDIIFGFDGNDEIHGGGCIDLIFGGDDNDNISGDAGQKLTVGNFSIELGNLLFGGLENDTIYGDSSISNLPGIDLIFGGDGIDNIHATHGGLFKIGNFEFKFGNVVFGGLQNDVITTKDGVDVLFGGDGNDTITAGKGHVLTLNNGSFALDLGDLIFGQIGDDNLFGDDSNQPEGGIDVIFGGIGNDNISAFNGGDLVINDFNFKFGNVLFGGEGNDILSELDGVGLLFGAEDNDTLAGGDGYTLSLNNGSFILNFGDLLIGGVGNDTLNGDASTDSDLNTDDGIDFLFGGDGDDSLYSGGGGLIQISSVTIKFGNVFFGGLGVDFLRADYITATGQDGIDVMFGGDNNDTLQGGAGGHITVGSSFDINFGGIMFGSNGDDTLNGGNGFDLIFSGDGIDTVTSSDGIDLIFGGNGADSIDGGSGGDVIIPVSGVPTPIPFGNIIFGNEGTDTITSAGRITDIDLLFGNSCDDTISAGDGLLDLIFGNLGNDTISGETGVDLIFGNSGMDQINAGAGVLDMVFGNSGVDTIHGDAEQDVIFGGPENDVIFGDDGLADLIFGGDGSDNISGGIGSDIIFGNKKADELHGNSGLDLLFGNSGDDVIHGEDGIDLLFGNSGTDQVYGENEADLIFGNSESDRLYGGADLDIIFGNSGIDWVYGEAGIDLLFGNSDNDRIFGGTEQNLIFGNSGNDALFGGDAIDLIFGNDNEDFAQGGAGRDLVFGNKGGDCLLDDLDRDLIFGNDGNDLLSAGNNSSGRVLLFGNKDNDQIQSGISDDVVFGNDGSDTIKSGPDGSNRDWLFGNRDGDDLYGCNDSDKLWGGLGNDTKHSNDCTAISFCSTNFGEIYGIVWEDTNGDGVADTGLSQVRVFLDTNGNNLLDSGETSTLSNVDDLGTEENEAGHYSFAGLAAGTYRVRQILPSGYIQFSPNPADISLSSTQIVFGVNFTDQSQCRPLSDGSACTSGTCAASGNQCLPSQVSTISTCSNDNSTCTTNADCGCGGTCVQRNIVLDCECSGPSDCNLGGDIDNFSHSGDTADAITIRPEFAAWLNRPGGSNALFHGGVTLPFDVAAQAVDWYFGYSFLNLPQIQSAHLTVHLKAGSTIPSTDGFALQFDSQNVAFAWGRSIKNLDGLFGGDGNWTANEDLTFTLDLSKLPLSGGGTLNLIPRLNQDSYLDVYVQDDTGIDYLRLCYELSNGGSACEDHEWRLDSLTGPSARRDHKMVFIEETGQYSLLFGGFDGNYSDEIWWWHGSIGWFPLFGAGLPPRARHGMAYDIPYHRVVIFGGNSPSGTLSDTWLFDVDHNSEELVDTTGPQARSGHQMVYDIARDLTVLFGGSYTSGGSSATELRVSGQAGTPTRTVTWTWGSPTPTPTPSITYFGDTWTWNTPNRTWQLASSSGPSPRELHAMAYDRVRDETILFGGRTANGDVSDTWSWNGTSWTRRATTGPTPRSGAEMVYNPNCDRMILFGGRNASGFLDETWAWDSDNDQWTLINTPGASPRSNFAMSYDQVSGGVVLNGGISANGVLEETWIYQNLSTAINRSNVACGSSQNSDAYSGMAIAFPEVKCANREELQTKGSALSVAAPPPPLIAPPPHDILKSRYISFDPNSGGDTANFAIAVKKAPLCQSLWVGEPTIVYTVTGEAEYVANLVDEPVYRAWPEKVIHLSGCIVTPESEFELSSTADGQTFSSTLTLTTGKWGDIVGRSLRTAGKVATWSIPNGIVDAADKAAMQAKINGQDELHFTRIDQAGQWPDYKIDASDILALDEALQGGAYPPSFFPIKEALACPLGHGPSIGSTLNQISAEEPVL